jgi:hypothetical protein
MKKALSGTDSKRLLNECPTVVGMMTSSLESGGSWDAAVRMVASEGPPLSRKLFSSIVRKVDTKSSETMSSCVSDAMSELPESAAGYRRAVHMCMAASESSGQDERSNMLKDASDIALTAVKDMGDEYGASLNTPCMTVFGIGILVPMILMSILPMLSLGGMMGIGTIDKGSIVFVTLALIPAAILMISFWLRYTNPFLIAEFEARELRCALPLLLAIPLALVYLSLGGGVDELVLFTLAPASVASLAFMWKDVAEDKKRAKCEGGLRDCVFDMGSRMISGDNFESASSGAIAVRSECADAAAAYSRELSLCKGDAVKAVARSIRPISGDVAVAFADICRCSRRDVTDAGRLAIALGRQFQNRNHAWRRLEMNLKSMTDMMLATAVFFAPMVLGMSVSMLAPLSQIDGFAGMDGTAAVLSVYLAELCATIAVLMGSLGSGEGIRKMLWRFCLMCPIGQIIFCVCCGIVFRCLRA